MKKETLLLAVCNQKRGVGKSVLTTLISSYLYFYMDKSVAVIDCDYPQFSIFNMREEDREKVASNTTGRILQHFIYQRISRLLPNRKQVTSCGAKQSHTVYYILIHSVLYNKKEQIKVLRVDKYHVGTSIHEKLPRKRTLLKEPEKYHLYSSGPYRGTTYMPPVTYSAQSADKESISDSLRETSRITFSFNILA